MGERRWLGIVGTTTWLTLVAGLFLGAVVALEVWSSPLSAEHRVALVAVTLAGGWGFLAAGALVRRPEPANLTGVLMQVLGCAWLLGALQMSDRHRIAVTVGALFGGLWAAVLAHLTVAFPSGRLSGRSERILVGCAYLVGLVGEWAWVVCAGPRNLYPDGCDRCARPLISLGVRPHLASLMIDVQGVSAAIVAVAGCLVLLSHWRRGTMLQRRALVPVLAVGGLAGLLLGGSFGFWAVGMHELSRALRLPYEVALALVPFAFAAGVLRTQLRGAFAVTKFMNDLSLIQEPERVSQALGSALGDERLSVLYWLPDRRRYVDGDGHEIAPADADDRVLTEVELDGRRVAGLLHDPLLLENAQSVRAAGRAAALWLERARLEAERNARLIELRESRGRLVETADAERRRIERDLHDGAQQRLAAMLLQTKLRRRAAAQPSEADALLDDLERGLAAALGELRALAAGILPPVLTDHGLPAALEELAARTPVPLAIRTDEVGRLPERVEAAAYFVVAEALANVIKHAHAQRAVAHVARENGSVVIEVTDDGVGGATPAHGTGLRGLADRVGALKGILTCMSPAGGGTVLRAEIPCES